MAKNLYKVVFINQDTIYEIYAERFLESEMYGFIEVESIVFGETSAVVVDPSEERLKNEFNGVKRTYIPVHSIIRIDQVEKQGTAKIKEAKSGTGTVSPFPFTKHNPEKL